jgi:3-hydroxyisobutyrate dehydrogenase-like beta-hydroxyacid dehydrogenase
MRAELTHITLIGFGEAGGILGADLAKAGPDVVVYDILLERAETRTRLRARAADAGVRCAASTLEAVRGADLVISAVTASASTDVARAAAPALAAGQAFLDINSVAPATKRINAELIEARGATYVDAAVMAPVPPQRLAVPMLLGGSQAAELAGALNALGMNTVAIAREVGVASAVKMCRSILIKGLEALALESLLAARHFGAEEQVLASLQRSFPDMGWGAALPDYLISRIAEHGRRRVEEMREVARTLEDVHLEPLMARATAARQEWLVEAMQAHGLNYQSEPAFSWRSLIDRLREKK